MSRGTGTNGESRAPAWKEDEWVQGLKGADQEHTD